MRHPQYLLCPIELRSRYVAIFEPRLEALDFRANAVLNPKRCSHPEEVYQPADQDRDNLGSQLQLLNSPIYGLGEPDSYGLPVLICSQIDCFGRGGA